MSKILQMWEGMTGTILPYALAAAPDGWLMCDGSALLAGTADVLRQKLIDDGSIYGDDGGGNPYLPDLRGEFMRGFDAGRGIDAGRALGSAQADEFKDHTHDVSEGDTNTGGAAMTAGAGLTDTAAGTNASASTGGTETRPRNIAVNFIIKT